MQVTRIKHLNPLLSMQLSNLLELLRGGDAFDIPTYFAYLHSHLSKIAVFAAWNNSNEMIGYVHVEPPHPLWPDEGSIMIGISKPGTDRTTFKRGLLLAERWLESKGATKWFTNTYRNPKAMARILNATVETSGNYRLEKIING